MKKILKKLYILIICILTTIIPNKVNAARITLNKSQMLLDIGYSETLKYTLDGELNESNIIWHSSNPTVASVQNGRVKAITRGETIITVKINNYSATCKVTVSGDYIAVTGIKLNKENFNILINSTEKLTANISPSTATNKNITWYSDDSSIVSVDSKGNITAKKIGSTVITATAGNYSTTTKVTVVDKISLKKITINKSSLTIKEKETAQLSINYNPSNATNKKVTWKSSNTTIATVDQNGKITAKNPGTTTITAMSNDGGLVATSKITVEAISKKVQSISLNKKELNIVAGEETELKATINPTYAENKNVTWSSSDEEIATVENGVVKALKPGTTEIKVISEDGEKEAICKLTVTAPPLKGISFKEESKTIYINEKITLKPVLEPTNSELINAKWKSEDENIVSVENGKITAKSIGKTKITVSTEDEKISATIEIIVKEKPKEKLNITIEGYDLNFNPETKSYKLIIGNEQELKINTNVDTDKVTINGNKNLKKGSIITINIKGETQPYIITIDKKQNYTIIFIAIISVLLLLNLIRIMVSSKKKKKY